jgi:hypothetical protein
MTRQNAIRVREVRRLDDQREPVFAGMVRLINAIVHLRKIGSPEDFFAIELLGDLEGHLERENKTLCQKADDLWRAVLESHGAELSSKEIAEEQRRVQEGLDWLWRIHVHILKSIHIRKPVTSELSELEASVVCLDDLESDLRRSRRDLDLRQEQYRMARAEAEARNFSYSDN